MKIVVLIAVLFVTSGAWANQRNTEFLGQQVQKPVLPIQESVRKVTDRFEEPYPFKEYVDKALAAWNYYFHKKEDVVVKDDGFVYVKHVKDLAKAKKGKGYSLFDVVKDALRQSPEDWEQNDYRWAKTVHTHKYFRRHFAKQVARRVGKKVFCKRVPVCRLGKMFNSSNCDELKSSLGIYKEVPKNGVGANDADVFLKEVLCELKSSSKQTSIVCAKYPGEFGNHEDRKQWILVYKAEACKVREIDNSNNMEKEAVALHFVDMDPLMKESFVSDEDVRAACHRMFVVGTKRDLKRNISFEHTYLKKHKKAHRYQRNAILQGGRYLTKGKVFVASADKAAKK